MFAKLHHVFHHSSPLDHVLNVSLFGSPPLSSLLVRVSCAALALEGDDDAAADDDFRLLRICCVRGRAAPTHTALPVVNVRCALRTEGRPVILCAHRGVFLCLYIMY